MKLWMTVAAVGLWASWQTPVFGQMALPTLETSPVIVVANPVPVPFCHMEERSTGKRQSCRPLSNLGRLIHKCLAPFRVPSEVLMAPAPPADLQALGASPVEILAAKIKVDEYNLPARVEAIRFLAAKGGYCRHEIEEALVVALRSDAHESVRWEAAKALANGCAHTSRALEQLLLVVRGSAADGFPPETSPRVKETANLAVQRLLAQRPNYLPAAAPGPPREPAITKENPPSAIDLQLTTFASQKIIDKNVDPLLRNFAGTSISSARPSQRNLWHIFQNTLRPAPPTTVLVPPPTPTPLPPPLMPIGQVPAAAAK